MRSLQVNTNNQKTKGFFTLAHYSFENNPFIHNEIEWEKIL